MFAGVILSNSSTATDKAYEYSVPEWLELEIGDAVIVPFGNHNTQTEGYVIDLHKAPSSKTINYKKVKCKSPNGVSIDEDVLSVALWMREKYLCTYAEAISACIPRGITSKTIELYSCDADSVAKGPVKTAILDEIKANGGTLSRTKLVSKFGAKVGDHLHALCADGILSLTYETVEKVKDKTVLTASLAVDRDEALEACKTLSKKSPKAVAVLELLLDNAKVSVKDINEFTGTTGSSVKTLLKHGLIKCERSEILRDVTNIYVKREDAKVLTDEQSAALSQITDALDAGTFNDFLLYGVTASGKTEVFIQAIEHALSMGKKAIVLVPEISLTPQTVNRFTARFPDRIAVFHSALSMGERYDQWKKMRRGEADIVVGARSAIFAPLKDVGIIIIDEEHSDTYKSEQPPRYDAREVAEFRAKKAGAVLLKASATPTFESYHAATTGKIGLLELRHRATNVVMPSVHIVDMREELEAGNRSVFSRKLLDEVAKNLERKEQTILFMNRRGFSTFVSCRQCGYVAECPNCSISLTYHKNENKLRCHYCGYEIPNYKLCPKCNSKYIRYFGGGTQKVEEEIKRIFPMASTIRMDIDTTGKKHSHQEILQQFENEHIDILVGTQMVTKGLDFENVTLVGVVSADVSLHIDDFRSGERTFDLIEQVSGRAGRGRKEGRAVIQTYSPEASAISLAAEHDYTSFYNGEIHAREMMWYPPFCEMICVRFSGAVLSDVAKASRLFVKTAEGIGYPTDKLQLLGPIPSAISKINNKYRWQLIIKCPHADSIALTLIEARQRVLANELYKEVTIIIDKNPINII